MVTELGYHIGLLAEDYADYSDESFRLEVEEINNMDVDMFANEQIADAFKSFKIGTLIDEKKRHLVAGYRKVLSEIRPLGGVFPGHKDTDMPALKTMNAVVGKNFPSEWIKKSSDTPLVFKEEDGIRAYYRKDYPYEDGNSTIVLTQAYHLTIKASEVFQRGLSLNGDNVVPAGPVIEYKDPKSGKIEESVLYVIPDRVVFDDTVDKKDKNGRPIGGGWKWGHAPSQDDATWYHHGTAKGKYIPTLMLATKRSSHDDANASHEFCHRVEDVVGNGAIMSLEESFLKRRTTNAEGTREPLTHMVHSNQNGSILEVELGRKGNFMTHYIGKEYVTHSSREVLSVGAEALFHGDYGAFVGIDDNYPADVDHRAFVLGVFAIV